jgi:hypothetical protein
MIHFKFSLIQATANILAFVFNIQLESNENVVKSLAKDVIPQKFIPKKDKNLNRLKIQKIIPTSLNQRIRRSPSKKSLSITPKRPNRPNPCPNNRLILKR